MSVYVADAHSIPQMEANDSSTKKRKASVLESFPMDSQISIILKMSQRLKTIQHDDACGRQQLDREITEWVTSSGTDVVFGMGLLVLSMLPDETRNIQQYHRCMKLCRETRTSTIDGVALASDLKSAFVARASGMDRAFHYCMNVAQLESTDVIPDVLLPSACPPIVCILLAAVLWKSPLSVPPVCGLKQDPECKAAANRQLYFRSLTDNTEYIPSALGSSFVYRFARFLMLGVDDTLFADPVNWRSIAGRNQNVTIPSSLLCLRFRNTELTRRVDKKRLAMAGCGVQAGRIKRPVIQGRIWPPIPPPPMFPPPPPPPLSSLPPVYL